jgi:hypothetical protein
MQYNITSKYNLHFIRKKLYYTHADYTMNDRFFCQINNNVKFFFHDKWTKYYQNEILNIRDKNARQ